MNSASHDELALEAARRSIILLENKGGILPLKKNQYKTIAVIGPNADTARLGTYSTQQPKYFVTVRQGIQKAVGSDVKVLYSKGTDIQNPESGQIMDAVSVVKQADMCVLVLGDDNKTVMENVDRDDITLPGEQEKLMKAIAATGKPVVLVLLHGRPAAIQWAKDNIPAILDGWFLGQETGTAVADAIFGNINPSAKLTVTYPRNVGQVPAFYNSLAPGRLREIWNSSFDPTYPFGYGLSYTTFSYSPVTLLKTETSKGEHIVAEVEVKNTGKVAGDEIVQLYIRDEISSLARPLKELKGFQRISLNAGQSKKLSFLITPAMLEFWKDRKWTTEPGEFLIMIGPNSVDLKSVKLVTH